MPGHWEYSAPDELHVNKPPTITTVSADTTLDSTHEIVLVDTNTAGMAVTITLPTAVGFTRTYTIKNLGDTYQVHLNTTGGQTIDTYASGVIPCDFIGSGGMNSLELVSNNANWWITQSHLS